MRLTIQEAVEWAGVSERTLRRAINDGVLDAVKHLTWHPETIYSAEMFQEWHYSIELSDLYLWWERHYGRRPSKRTWTDKDIRALLDHAQRDRPLRDYAAQFGKTYQATTKMLSRLRNPRRPYEVRTAGSYRSAE